MLSRKAGCTIWKTKDWRRRKKNKKQNCMDSSCCWCCISSLRKFYFFSTIFSVIFRYGTDWLQFNYATAYDSKSTDDLLCVCVLIKISCNYIYLMEHRKMLWHKNEEKNLNRLRWPPAAYSLYLKNQNALSWLFFSFLHSVRMANVLHLVNRLYFHFQPKSSDVSVISIWMTLFLLNFFRFLFQWK